MYYRGLSVLSLHSIPLSFPLRIDIKSSIVIFLSGMSRVTEGVSSIHIEYLMIKQMGNTEVLFNYLRLQVFAGEHILVNREGNNT